MTPTPRSIPRSTQNDLRSKGEEGAPNPSPEESSGEGEEVQILKDKTDEDKISQFEDMLRIKKISDADKN